MPISAPAVSTSKRTLTAALEAADLQAAVAALRQDIIFHSPILATVGDEVRGLHSVVQALQTALTCLGMPQNVEEFQNPDGRYIVTFDDPARAGLDRAHHHLVALSSVREVHGNIHWSESCICK
jgi:hypothetical protein